MFKKKSLSRILGLVIVSSFALTPNSGAILSCFSSSPEKNLESAQENLNVAKENLNSIIEKCESFHGSSVEAISKLEESVSNLKKFNESSRESFESLNKAFNEWFESGCSSKSDSYDKYIEIRESFNNNLENFRNALKEVNAFNEGINNLSVKPQYPYLTYKDSVSSLTKAYYNYEKASAELIK